MSWREVLHRGLVILLVLAFAVAGLHGLPRLHAALSSRKAKWGIGHFKFHLEIPRFKKFAVILPDTCAVEGTGPLCAVDGVLLASCGTDGSRKLLAYLNQQPASLPVHILVPTNDGTGKLTAYVIRYLLWPRPVVVTKSDTLTALSPADRQSTQTCQLLLSGFTPTAGMPDGQWIAPRVYAFRPPPSSP
ncbi:MAG: hypothetical protein QM796_03950 [Chthoniobacteraceae bacterium]